jgi:Bacterial Ig-like domain (group 3)
MRFPVPNFIRLSAAMRCLAVLLPAVLTSSLLAQNSIQLFGPVNVRLSSNGTGFGSSAVNFNSTTLNLTCSAEPITAVLSSTADGTGNILVDNNINVTVTAGTTATGPTNICTGGVNGSPAGSFQNCFAGGYESAAASGSATGADPDTLLSTDGIPPIRIDQLLVPGPSQVKIDLQDEGNGTGFYLASSTLYLNTNCTQGGVTGPALVTGNPIPSNNATPDQLSQDFSFNPIANQQIGFQYDLTTAQSAGSLTVSDGTIPQVGDLPIDPSTFQSIYLPKTSFATSNCLVHSGELLPSGLPACKLFTLQCTIGTGANASGAQCPASTQSNEIFQDVFDGPAFTLADIPTPNGPTFHEGIGFLMASEGWGGGPCTYEAAADLPNLPCPQNLLTSFASSIAATSNVRKANLAAGHASTSLKADPIGASVAQPRAAAASAPSSGTYASTGRTTHPNSTFITVAQVPEDLTTITVAGQQPGYWIKSSSASVTLSSQPPNLAGTTLPGAADFVASPIQSIAYGISPVGSVPQPGDPSLADTILTSSTVCPTLAHPTGVPASIFTPAQQTLKGLADGRYLLHYYAQDCAGTEELQFNQDGSGNWATSFYTYPINVDTVAPVVASGPTLSPAPSSQGTYQVGQAVSASFSCTDALSGVIHCGSYTYAAGATTNTGTLTSVVDTASPGSKTFTVQAVDAAGNKSSLASVTYQVVSAYDSQIQFTISPQTVTYPQGTNVVVQILPGATSSAAVRGASKTSHAPTGTVKILDGAKLIDTLRLQGNGAAYDYLHGLAAGKHILTAVYSGDAANPGGTSAPVTLTVQPARVNLGLSCWNSTFPYGANYSCGAYTSSAAGPPQGVITYQYDNAAPVTVPLNWGVALFSIPKPAVGRHTVVVSYAAQTNYAAATPQKESFTVTLAPVNISLTPSSAYLTGGNLKLTASVQSWSAGPPRSTGAVTFSDGSKVLAVVPVNAAGAASFTVAATALSNGSHTFTAAYSGGTNYGTGHSSVVVTVAHH